jgi:hypothetical protein
MAFTVCWRDGGNWKCKSIPVLLEPWWEWVFTPARDRERPGGISLLERIRISLQVFRDPPNPWREIGVALPVEARRDLGILATIARLSERLGPGAREVLHASLADAAARVPLPAGTEARWDGGAVPRSRAISA